MILWRGERRTPGEMARILILNKLDELPEDWTPQNLPVGPTPAEQLAVAVQIEKLKGRIARLLRLGEERPLQKRAGAPLCQCGHAYDEHVPLPGHPDGVEECQVGDCGCGKWRPEVLAAQGAL